jgi:flagellin-like hook-associated protein FlgL
MVVQHNLTALNANRMFNLTQSTLSSSTEKLSSGYKINRAADDAAGLSISEKMRKQIRGLTQASTNAEDGISAVQTAEGALSEVTDMLQRMNELATKAANGTNSESDRQTIQDEISQLTTEIDRVAETTKFNEIYLLKGNADGTKSQQLINAHDAGLAGSLVDNGKTATFTLDDELKNGSKITIAGTEYTIGEGEVSDDLSSTKGYNTYNAISADKISVGDSITATTSSVYTLTNKIANNSANFSSGDVITITNEDGTAVSYTVSSTTVASLNNYTAADISKLIDNNKASAHSIQLTTVKAGTSTAVLDTGIDIVDASDMGTNEMSNVNRTDSTGTWDGSTIDAFASTAAASGGLALTPSNDVSAVTLSGEKTTITPSDPVSASDLANIISTMVAGDTFEITTNGGAAAVSYTIADTTDARNNLYTVDDAIELINQAKNDLDQVNFTTVTGQGNS